MSLTVPQTAGLQISKYFNVAGMAILIFDYAITIEDEVCCIWGKPWDFTRVIFTISRYVPFVGLGLTAYAVLRSNWMPCPLNIEENAMQATGIIAAEILLIVRTYAFWRKDRRVLFGLVIYALLITAAAATFNFMTNYNFIPGSAETIGCYLMSSRNGVLVYSCILAFEMVILALIAYKQYSDYRHTCARRSFVRVIFMDCVFYATCISLITVANIIVNAAFPIEYSDLFQIPQFTLHSVLASRIIFHLHKSKPDTGANETSELTTIIGEREYGISLEWNSFS